MQSKGAGSRQADAREAEQVARAAWLHFVGGLTQSEVAARLAVPTTRAHRYIARAQNDGLVRVFVDVESTECVALEARLMQAFDLTYCRVAMDVPETGPLPLRALSAVGADYLMQVVQSGAHPVIGIGNGRSIIAAVDAMGRVTPKGQRFVSMLGGLTRTFAANPYDALHRLALKTGAESYLMPAPLYANSAGDKQIMLGQHGMAATMRLIDEATLVIVGVGDLIESSSAALAPGNDGRDPLASLRDQGACSEILGQFISSTGAIMSTHLDDRVMAPALSTLRGREIVAIAGGKQKQTAIKAALKSRLLTGLIVDEATARDLVGTLDREDAIAAA